MSLLAPPPTYADLLIKDPHTNQTVFNPIWLDWFLTMVKILNNSGGSSGITHNSLGGLQGGTVNEYYHFSLANYNLLATFLSGSLVVTSPVTISATPYTVTSTEFSLLCNAGVATVLTLPSAVNYKGKLLILTNLTAFAVTSAGVNVVPLGSTTPGSAILAATVGKFAMLQSDGTNWITLMAN